MAKKVIYQNGDKIGNFTVIREVQPHFYKYKQYIRPTRRVIAKCHCGIEIEICLHSALHISQKACKSCSNKLKTKHGLSYHPLKKIWVTIKQRCLNPKQAQYKNYGGRGITICEEWRDDLKAFYDYVTTLEHYGEPGRTLDRERNNEGYKPGNMRWATWHTQSVNQRLNSRNSSGVIGVSQASNGKWKACISVRKKRYELGTFNTKEAAAEARNQFIIENNLKEYRLQQV